VTLVDRYAFRFRVPDRAGVSRAAAAARFQLWASGAGKDDACGVPPCDGVPDAERQRA